MRRISIVFPNARYSTRDCAVGYSSAFNSLGFDVNDIRYELLWEHYYSLYGESEETYRKATSHAVFKIIDSYPDFVVVIDGSRIHNIFWKWMAKLNIKTAVVMTDCPYYDKVNAAIAEKTDYPFANDRLSARKMGIPYLPLAYDSNVHHPFIVSDKYKSDVIFVGTGFPERVEFLEQINWSGIDFKLLGYWPDNKEIIPNDEAVQYYNGAKIALNLDRVSVDIDGEERIEGRESPGPRVFEVSACGTLLASQSPVSILGDNYLLCETPQKMSKMIREWLCRDDDRAILSNNARRAVEGESYVNRAITMLDTISLD